MKLYKKFYYTACSVLPTRVLKKIAPATTLLPYHHIVSDKEVLHVKHLYPYKNICQFKSDLEHLLKYFRPVAVSEIAEAVAAGKKMPEGSFLLSFDDGFREVYEVVAPILSTKGVPAVFFIVPAFLDNRQLFYRCKISLVIEKLIRKKNDKTLLTECAAILGGHPFQSLEKLIVSVRDINNLNQDLINKLGTKLELSFEEYLQEQKPFLTTQQVKELGDKGFSIGAHSWDHPYYDLISGEEQQRQTINSCLFLKEKFSPALNLFSFPHSDKELPQEFFDKIRFGEKGIDLFFGTQNQKLELSNKVLHRFNAERPELPMTRQLNGILTLMAFQRLLNKQKVKRKHRKNT